MVSLPICQFYPQGWALRVPVTGPSLPFSPRPLGVSPSGPRIPYPETGHQHPHPTGTHPHTHCNLPLLLSLLIFPSAGAVTGRAVATGMRHPQTPSLLTGTGWGRGPGQADLYFSKIPLAPVLKMTCRTKGRKQGDELGSHHSYPGER